MHPWIHRRCADEHNWYIPAVRKNHVAMIVHHLPCTRVVVSKRMYHNVELKKEMAWSTRGSVAVAMGKRDCNHGEFLSREFSRFDSGLECKPSSKVRARLAVRACDHPRAFIVYTPELRSAIHTNKKRARMCIRVRTAGTRSSAIVIASVRFRFRIVFMKNRAYPLFVSCCCTATATLFTVRLLIIYDLGELEFNGWKIKFNFHAAFNICTTSSSVDDVEDLDPNIHDYAEEDYNDVFDSTTANGRTSNGVANSVVTSKASKINVGEGVNLAVANADGKSNSNTIGVGRGVQLALSNSDNKALANAVGIGRGANVADARSKGRNLANAAGVGRGVHQVPIGITSDKATANAIGIGEGVNVARSRSNGKTNANAAGVGRGSNTVIGATVGKSTANAVGVGQVTNIADAISKGQTNSEAIGIGKGVQAVNAITNEEANANALNVGDGANIANAKADGLSNSKVVSVGTGGPQVSNSISNVKSKAVANHEHVAKNIAGSRLKITRVDVNDRGFYSCRASSGKNFIQSEGSLQVRTQRHGGWVSNSNRSISSSCRSSNSIWHMHDSTNRTGKFVHGLKIHQSETTSSNVAPTRNQALARVAARMFNLLAKLARAHGVRLGSNCSLLLLLLLCHTYTACTCPHSKCNEQILTQV
ncbi:unnamed protein product [Trichogramma brassicae]|uniref:Ig-like domain-containing protein n=1 Tax=Trichogramma brassicae TaxID=86971 RepID=A0A6H5IRQ5_9HYME|nr:unnamed protein product [Trichogramma brassicae]